MFNLFKKKYLPILEYKESWSILQESLNSTVVRVNMGYKQAMGHPDFPIKMGIALPVKEHDKVVIKIKSDIEDFLNETLLKKGNGVLVAIISGLKDQKFIEFLSYTKKSEVDFAKIHQELKDKYKDYEVQMYANNDPKWEAYKSFAHL